VHICVVVSQQRLLDCATTSLPDGGQEYQSNAEPDMVAHVNNIFRERRLNGTRDEDSTLEESEGLRNGVDSESSPVSTRRRLTVDTRRAGGGRAPRR